MQAASVPLHLNIPQVPAAHFQRNFITQAVLELRFPVLFEIDEPKPPAAFANALRKTYPVYSPRQELNISAVGDARNASSVIHVFHGRNSWVISLRASSVVLETTRYESFEKFMEQAELMIKVVKPIIDSDFFTRVGLRYTNALPFFGSPIDEWVNPDLVKPLASGLLGQPHEFSGRINGTTPDGGGFLFQHGLGDLPQGKGRVYVLDFDLFKEDVPVDEAVPLLHKLHAHEYSMFSWAIGDKARAHLGPSKK